METPKLSPVNQTYINSTPPSLINDSAKDVEKKTQTDDKKLKQALIGLAAVGVAAVSIGVAIKTRSSKNQQNALNAVEEAADESKKALEAAKEEIEKLKDEAQKAKEEIQKLKDETKKAKEKLEEAAKRNEELSAPVQKVISSTDAKLNRLKAIEHFCPNSSSSIQFYQDRPGMFYRDSIMELYDNIRHCAKPYALRETCSADISKIASKDSDKIKVSDSNGWFYRLPLKSAKEPVVDRISLNVFPEEELISKLDDFVAKSNGMVEYKTPLSTSSWNKRHDPITIYFRKPVDEGIEKEIIELATPFIRKTDNEVLIGRKIADSIYEVPEPNEKDVQELIKRAKALNFDDGLIKCLEDVNPLTGASLYTFNHNNEKIVRTSPGVVEAVKQLLDEIEKIN